MDESRKFFQNQFKIIKKQDKPKMRPAVKQKIVQLLEKQGIPKPAMYPDIKYQPDQKKIEPAVAQTPSKTNRRNKGNRKRRHKKNIEEPTDEKPEPAKAVRSPMKTKPTADFNAFRAKIQQIKKKQNVIHTAVTKPVLTSSPRKTKEYDCCRTYSKTKRKRSNFERKYRNDLDEKIPRKRPKQSYRVEDIKFKNRPTATPSEFTVTDVLTPEEDSYLAMKYKRMSLDSLKTSTGEDTSTIALTDKSSDMSRIMAKYSPDECQSYKSDDDIDSKFLEAARKCGGESISRKIYFDDNFALNDYSYGSDDDEDEDEDDDDDDSDFSFNSTYESSDSYLDRSEGDYTDDFEYDDHDDFEYEDSYHSDRSGDTYDRFMNGTYVDNPNDPDFVTDDVYIPKGQANYTTLKDTNLPFDSDDENLQIIELNKNDKSESSSLSSMDSCPVLVPINDGTEIVDTETPVNIITVKTTHKWDECPLKFDEPVVTEVDNDTLLQNSISIPGAFVKSVDYNCPTADVTTKESESEDIAMTKQDGSIEEIKCLSAVTSATATNLGSECFEDALAYQPIVPSKFFNSLNSRHVLLVLKDYLYFHGNLSIKLLAGSANIFGYELKQHETVKASSPRGHSFLFIKPTPKTGQMMPIKLDDLLENYKGTFLSADLEQIRHCFKKRTDALILLEKVTDIPAVNMIRKYMKQVVFPNASAFNARRAFYSSEFILATQFWLQTNKGLRINPQWNNYKLSSHSRFIIFGGKGVGKSTLTRYLINSHLCQHKRILLIDLDIGQPELFVSQTVSATVVCEPILGVGYMKNIPPTKAYLFGHINVIISPIRYLKCVRKLLHFCQRYPDFKNIPWIVNTMGYNRGFGLEIAMAIIKLLDPTDIVQIRGHRPQDNFECSFTIVDVNSFSFKIFADEMKQILSNEIDFEYHDCRTMTKKLGERLNKWDIAPKDLRYIMILSKLGNILQGNAQWLSDVKPVRASIRDLEVIVLNEDQVEKEFLLSVLNGSLVYLCNNNRMNVQSTEEGDIVECYGIGIIRNIEIAKGFIYLLPAVTPTTLQHVNALAICSIPLPTSIILNQSNRIKGNLPYVYNTDDFVGSKQVMPITYRPDRLKKNTKHVQLLE